MAPVKEKRPVQTLQQALVELDKSTEGFAEQISKAYKIAGIALKDNSTLLWGLTTNVQLERSYALSAKEEWVLRWLLNRLQAKEEVGKNARSDPRSWLLLIRLLQQIPPANAARVLNTHKFLLILEQTSNEVRDLTGSLHDNCPVNGSLFHSPNQSEDSGTSALLDSSSTVVDSLSEDSLRKSRKRKRASRAAQHVQPRSSPAERRREFYTLLLSVLKAIGCIVRASGTSGTHKPAFACEYMKSVLRTDAKAAARIVGRLLSSGSFVLQEIDHRSMTFEHNGSWAGALLEIWNNRAVTADDTLGESSNAAFSSECLSSIALLLSRYRSLITQSSATKDTIRILEKLLARHLFIPARSAFFTPLFSKSQSLSETRRGEPKLLIDLLKPLREKNIAAQAQVDDTKYSEQPAGDLSSAIPFLLDIAIRCSPSSSPRKRLAERPWLQALFLGLLETADISTSPTSGQAKQQSRVLMLDQVLDVCIKREVSLKTDTLKTIMYQWSGLLEESGPVNWSLVGKLLKLDTNVFLPPKNKSGDTNEQGSADTDQLKLLLSKITGAITRDHSNFSKDYLIVKAQIIQPLMLGFSRARDLSGFLELWRGGLMVFEEQYAAGKHEGGNALSVWQDEDLSLWLREDLENSMTGGQIVQALFSAHHQLQSLLKIGPSALELPRKLGSSVIIDATLGAVAQEHTFDMLQNETLQVHLTVSGALLNTQYGAAHRWHLWRILARIYEHLPWAQILHSAKENGAEASLSDAKDLVNEAKITVQRAMPNAAKEIIMPHAADALEALHFLLAFNMSLTESSALMPLARDAMSEILEAATRMLSSNVPCPWSPSPTWGKDKVRSWGGDPENIPTLSNGGLLVPTMLLFYQFRRILSVSPSDVRRRLFRTLYWAAYWEDRLKLEDKREESLVREAQMASAWQALLADEYFLNDVSSKDHLLSTLRAGLSLSGNEQEDWIYKDETDPVNDGDVKSFAENNREEFNDFTIRCYLDLPLKVIHRQHREDVLDRLYQRTTDPAVRLSPSQLSNHVALMVRLMDLPNASSKFAMDPDTLWHMAKVQTSNYINNYQDEVNCKNFETLVRRTLT
ncbi:MAG: hypothetical protein M1812_006004 [Candelaria pacifica]|nr:MAG: hypothetical protein M1812_006004 [Candelaria pacifica]